VSHCSCFQNSVDSPATDQIMAWRRSPSRTSSWGGRTSHVPAGVRGSNGLMGASCVEEVVRGYFRAGAARLTFPK